MTLQIQEERCLCLKCPWKLRIKCRHYRMICLQNRSCSACQINNAVMVSCENLEVT